MSRCVALVVAGGSGDRFGSDLPKQYCRLGGTVLLRWTLRVFLAHREVDAVRVVIRPQDGALYRAATAGLALLPPVGGGASRQESVRCGLESLAEEPPERVLIHDAARPFVGSELITRVLAALDDAPGAVPALPVADTLKRGDADGRRVLATVERTGLWRAQTPQGFHFAAILAAHRQRIGGGYSDDAAVAEAAGLAVAIVRGDENNIKMTSQQDLQRAERWLAGGAETRTGLGFDVHRFAPGDQVTLGGIPIPCHARLSGHSDADVALHALSDALFGAIGAGDIGQHFPPGDPRWKDAPSEVFVRRAAELVAATGGRIVNIDLTLICERPKIGPHRAAMIERIAAILGIDAERVGVKATTTETLGFTGREEGIAAQAVATVQINKNT